MSDLTPAEQEAMERAMRPENREIAMSSPVLGFRVGWLAARDFYAAELARLREVEKDWAAYGAGGARREAELDADVDKAEAERDVLKAALEILADRENWLGDPLSQESCLYGPDTPFELARAALAAVEPSGERCCECDGTGIGGHHGTCRFCKGSGLGPGSVEVGGKKLDNDNLETGSCLVRLGGAGRTRSQLEDYAIRVQEVIDEHAPHVGVAVACDFGLMTVDVLFTPNVMAPASREGGA